MSEDRLLDELIRTAREREDGESLDERWDRLAAGTLSPAEEAELAALAATSEEARRAWEAFRPLGPAFEERIAGTLMGRTTAGTAAPATSPAASPGARILPFTRRRSLGVLAVVTALAASLALVVLLPGPEIVPLPGFEVELRGGVRTLRSGEPTSADAPLPDGVPDGVPVAAPVFAPGARFELLLRPATRLDPRLEGKLGVRLFLQGEGGPELWEVPVEIAPGGAVRIAGEIGRELPMPAGRHTVWIAVAPHGDLPTAEALAAGSGGGEGAPWVLYSVPLEVLPEPASVPGEEPG